MYVRLFIVNDLPSWSTCLSVFLSVGLRDESGLGRTPLSPTSVTSGYKSDVSYDRKLFYCCRCMALCCAYRFRPISSQLGALHSTLIPPHIPCLSFPVVSSVLYSVSPPVCYPFSRSSFPLLVPTLVLCRSWVSWCFSVIPRAVPCSAD